MNLEQSAASLLEQFPHGERLDLQKQEKQLAKFGTVAFGGFMVVVAIAIVSIIYYVLAKMVLSGEQPLAGLLLAAFILFAGLSLAYVVWNESLKEKRQKIGATPAAQAIPPASAAQLRDASFFAPAASVVEDTTELLDVKRKTKDLDQD
jgi:hypothetical protein